MIGKTGVNVFQNMLVRLYISGFLIFFSTFVLITFLGVEVLFSLYLAFVITVLGFSFFKFFVWPSFRETRERIKKLEDNAKQYDTGNKLLIRRDLELSRANEKLQEFDEAKSNFISIVAHQLRTPLSGIKWTMSMLINGDLGELNNDQKTFLMKSYESNNRMINLVNDMLNIDRIQSGKVRFGFRQINILDLLDNVLFEINSQAVKKNISIEFKDKVTDIPQVYVDPDSMREVLQNLLENAIKYTMDGGRVVVDLKKKDDNFVEISIQDNGIGIPELEQKNVFQRFFRAGNAVKKETDGSGLGLYIAKTVVEKNGGEIWFESELNKGTKFYFTVPIASSTQNKNIKNI